MPVTTDTQPGSDASLGSPRLLLEHHREWLAVRAIAEDIATERGYSSETSREALADLGFESYQRRVPCLLIPRFTTAGLNGDYQIRPDCPREQRRDGTMRPIKYETRSGSTARIDVHPRTVPVLPDPRVMLLINEATAKGDAALGVGFHSLNVAGVFGWRGKNPYGGTCTIGDFDDVALNGRRLVPIVDSDGRDNPMVLSAASRLKKMLERRGAYVTVIVLPPGPEGSKQGLDDFRFAGGDLAALIAEAETTPSGIYIAAPKRYAVNDIGNAQRFAAQHGQDVRFAWIEEKGLWHAWTGTHWSRGAYEMVQERAKQTMEAIGDEAGAEPDPNHQAELKQHAHKSNHRYPITSMLTLARSDSRIATRLDRFDCDPDLLNVANGVIDLRTGELRPHHRDDRLTMIAPVAYEANAPCPLFRAFLTRIFDGDSELIEYVQRALGYSLTGDTGARKIFIAEGGGANGKSTLFNLVADVLGDYAWNAPDAMLLAKRADDGPRNDLAALLGKRFVIASETGEGKRLDETLVKRLTGGDKVTARFLHKEWFEFYPTAKYWWFTNHLPDVRGGDQAIWDRLVRIPFLVRIPESEWIPDYHRVLFGAEAEGVLAWLVGGCLAWRSHGLQRPAKILEATAAYRREQDLLAPFLDERCVIDPMAQVGKSALYGAYAAWAEAQHERALSHKKFSERLLADADKRFADGPRTNKARFWTGLRLRAADDPPLSDHESMIDEGQETAVAEPSVTTEDTPADTTAVTDRDGLPDTASELSPVKSPEFTRIVTDVTDVTDSAAKSASRAHAQGGITEPSVTSVTSVTRITSDAQLAAALPDLFTADALGLDVETTGLDPRRDSLQLVQLATRDRVYLLDPAAVDLAALRPLLMTATSTIVSHNLGFDLAFLQAVGLPIPTGERLFNTMLASQIHDGGAHPIGAKTVDPSGTTGRGGKPVMVGYHTLAAVAHRWLGQILDKALQTSDWSGVLTDEQLTYAARDAAILLPLRDAFDTALADAGLATVAALECSALPAVIWMEATGVPLDVPAWTALRDEATATLATLDTALATALPGVNVDSPAQLIAALAGHGITIPNGQEATLRTVVDQHPAIDLVVRRKDAKKRVSTYGESYLRHVNPTTGRIHASYWMIGAASGRMACSAPNLQNIPRDPAYRRCVRPPAGRVLVKADYSQIELRIAAQISGDAAMQAAFRTGEDLHTTTARAVLGRDPTPHDRQLAKALNFGLLYGMGAERLRTYAQDEFGVTLSDGEAARFRRRFFQTYPGLKAWHRAQGEGEITTSTLGGRPRYRVSSFTEKLNSPMQGTGADILKGALARLWEDRASSPSAAPVLAVHDEVVVEVDASDAERCAAWLIAHMTAAGAALLEDVPVAVDASIVADWSGTPVLMSALT